MKRCTSSTTFGIVLAATLIAPSAIAQASPATAGDDRGALMASERARAAGVRSALGLDASQQLVVTDVVAETDGSRFVRYDRVVDGLPVIGGDLVIGRDSGGAVVQRIFDAGRDVGVASTSPRLSSEAATRVAADAVGYAVTGTSATLSVYAFRSGSSALAWDVVTTGVRADQTPSRYHTVIDARSGRVLDGWDEVADGTGNSMYSGTVSLDTAGSAGAYRLEDVHGNYTTDLFGATSGSGTLFTDADDTWGDGTPGNRQTAGVDAQYGAARTYAYYQEVQGRAGIWDTGSGARSRVHYGNAYVNAFWDGTQMTYGDGANNTHPLTSLDVAGHEMSHGVTENTAGLAYRGESGGLNEATSDIFGTAVEFHANNSSDPGDYLIGEKIDIFGDGSPLRYMDRPSRDGSSADCWAKNLRRLDVHYSSGPLNHWFYLVSEGSGASTVGGVSYNSPTCDGSSMSGVGHDVAEQVWYRTLTTKLTSRSDYADAREGAIASAKELYGLGSTECAAVRNGFDAIGVPAGSQTCTN